MKEEKGSPRGELAPIRATERGVQSLSFLIVNPSPSSLRDATSPQGEAFLHPEHNPKLAKIRIVWYAKYVE